MLVEEIRLTQDALRYGYAVGKVRVLQARTFDRAMYERLLDARDFAEQKRLLSETPYGRYIEHAQTPSDVEAALSAALEDFYGFLGEAALPEPVSHFFRIRHDFANLKAAAKARLLDAPLEGLLNEHGSVPAEAYTAEFSALPEYLASAVPEAVRLIEEMDEVDDLVVGQDETDSLAVDTAVDKAMFAELLLTARRSRSAYLLDLAKLAVDLANVKTILRARRAGHGGGVIRRLLIDGGEVPLSRLEPLVELAPEEIAEALAKIPQLKMLAGEPIQEPSRLDHALDAVTTAALQRGRMAPVGPEPVIAYVLTREVEVATVRMLLLGKLSGVKDETLRRHLRAME